MRTEPERVYTWWSYRAKDWAAADAVRDQLKQAGVVVEDTPHGPRWTVEDH